MLPAEHRMRSARDFGLTMRRGSRVRLGPLVVHQQVEPDASALQAGLVGFVVGRAVGNSVERHRVVRRLRAVTRERLHLLPLASRTVVRALPDAAGCDSATFASALDSALARLARAPHPRGSRSGARE